MTLEIDKITKPRQEVGLPKVLGSHSAANCKWSRMDKVVATRRFIASTMCLNGQGVHWRVALRKQQGTGIHLGGYLQLKPDQCLVHVLSLEGVNNESMNMIDVYNS